MNREEKTVIINSLAEKLREYSHFYLTDTSGLNAAQTAKLRSLCFDKEVSLVVVKNTLFTKALELTEKADADLVSALTGSTAIMFSNTGKAPAVLLQEFRKDRAKADAKAAVKPLLKAAYVEECVYLGDASLEALVNIKSRNELLGEIIGLLQSPAKNVISALTAAAGQKIGGIVKALEERNN